MKSQFKKIVVVVALSTLAFPSYATMEPNRPAPPKVQPSVNTPQRETVQSLVSQESRSPGQIEAELGKEYYRDCVQTLKWALGIIVTLLIVFVGYAAYKRGQEYKEVLADVRQALGDAREACKEARAASDKAREYEERARERLSRVDEAVGSKLKEIEEKGKTLITNLIQEAEKQRKITELWDEGLRALKAKDFESATKCYRQIVEDFKSEDASVYNNWGNALANLAKRKEGAESEEFFRMSLDKYEKAVQITPDDHEAYYNWGTALFELATRKEGGESEGLLRASFEKFEKSVQIKPDSCLTYNNWGIGLCELAKRKEGMESESLLRASFEKFEKAVQIKPDHHPAYDNWAAVLIEMAKRKDGGDRARLLEEAKQKCLKAESIEEGSSAYNLACAYALLGDEAGCRRWLETCQRCGTLPRRSQVMADADLESVRDKEWFKQIRWPQKAN